MEYKLIDQSIKELMTDTLHYIGPNAIMTEIAEIFETNSFHHVPVLNKKKEPLGIISRHDLNRLQHHFTHFNAKLAHGHNQKLFKSLLASEVMTPQPYCLDAEDKISSVLDVFLENKLHSILVCSDGKCVGIITPYDILKAIKNRN